MGVHSEIVEVRKRLQERIRVLESVSSRSLAEMSCSQLLGLCRDLDFAFDALQMGMIALDLRGDKGKT